MLLSSARKVPVPIREINRSLRHRKKLSQPKTCPSSREVGHFSNEKRLSSYAEKRLLHPEDKIFAAKECYSHAERWPSLTRGENLLHAENSFHAEKDKTKQNKTNRIENSFKGALAVEIHIYPTQKVVIWTRINVNSCGKMAFRRHISSPLPVRQIANTKSILAKIIKHSPRQTDRQTERATEIPR